MSPNNKTVSRTCGSCYASIQGCVLQGCIPGTGIEVFQNLQKFRVRAWKSYITHRSSGTYRSSEYGYECHTTLEVVPVWVIPEKFRRVWFCTYPTEYNLASMYVVSERLQGFETMPFPLSWFARRPSSPQWDQACTGCRMHESTYLSYVFVIAGCNSLSSCGDTFSKSPKKR